MYKQSNELEEVGVISLTGVKVDNNTDMELLLGVSVLSRSFHITYPLS